MSRIFGPVRQNGYVLRDIEKALHHWTTVLGVGPFFYKEQVPIENYMYRGESYRPHNSVALANSGPLCRTQNARKIWNNPFQRLL